MPDEDLEQDRRALEFGAEDQRHEHGCGHGAHDAQRHRDHREGDRDLTLQSPERLVGALGGEPGHFREE